MSGSSSFFNYSNFRYNKKQCIRVDNYSDRNLGPLKVKNCNIYNNVTNNSDLLLIYHSPGHSATEISYNHIYNNSSPETSYLIHSDQGSMHNNTIEGNIGPGFTNKDAFFARPTENFYNNVVKNTYQRIS